MRGQPKVVVRRQIDDRLVVEGSVSFRPAVQHPQPAIEALLLERLEFVTQECKRIFSHTQQSETSNQKSREYSMSPSGNRSTSVAPRALSQLSTISAFALFAKALR